MRYRDITGVLATSLLFLIAAPSLAQDQQRDRDQDRQVDRDQTMDQDRTMDHDRMMDRTMDKDQDRDRTMDKDKDQDRDQDRDRLRIHQDEEIYGGDLMTEQERNRYRERLQNAGSKDEQKQIRAEHQKMIQERARQKGVELPPPPPESE